MKQHLEFIMGVIILAVPILILIILVLLFAGCDRGPNPGFISPGKDVQAEFDQRVNTCYSFVARGDDKLVKIESRIKTLEFCTEYVEKSTKFANCNVTETP